jgi:hypothetical protein
MRRKYRASQTPVEVRAFAVRVLLELEKVGVHRDLVLNAMRVAGYAPSERTVRRHKERVRSGEEVLASNKASGRPPSLDEAEREVCAGFVLAQNVARKEVHLADYVRFVSEHFGVELSSSTATRYLEQTGFRSRIVKSKASGFMLDAAAECKLMLHWVKMHRELLTTSRAKLASLDFTYTGHRTEHRVSFGALGTAQPKSKSSLCRFTNCIITVVWADGKNRTPPMLFTLNQSFRFDRPSTRKREQDVERLESLLAKYRIERSRVIYVGKPKGEKGVYVPESADLIRRFWRLYKIPKDAVIFSDEGISCFPAGESVLEELGFSTHESYPPAVHQYLSPNDNCLHGTAKQRWRHSGVDFHEDVEASLQLLNYLDCDIDALGKHWWDRNLLKLTTTSVEELIAGTARRRAELNKKRLHNYHTFMKEESAGRPTDESFGLDDAFDQIVWE